MDYPKTFEDTQKRKWTIAITWGTFARVKDRTGVDLDAVVPKKGAKKEDNELAIERYLDLIYSSTDFPAVLFVILESQMQQQGVSPTDLAEAFDDATVDAATKAFHQAIADFIRDPQLRKPFQKIMLGVEKA